MQYCNIHNRRAVFAKYVTCNYVKTSPSPTPMPFALPVRVPCYYLTQCTIEKAPWENLIRKIKTGTRYTTADANSSNNNSSNSSSNNGARGTQ